MNRLAVHTDSLARRMSVYVQERFPLAAHLPLIALLFLASTEVALALSGSGERLWFGAWALLLAFFALRLSDDDHDFAHDAQAHPERPLPRGLLSVAELRGMGVGVVAALLILAAALGPAPLYAALGCLVFMAILRVGAPRLEGQPFLIAITHNPLLAGLTTLAGACTTQGLTVSFGWYAATVSGAGLVFELGRKWRRYTQASPAAGRWALAFAAVTSALLGVTLGILSAADPLRVGLAALPLTGTALWLRPWRGISERAAERAATLFLALVLVTISFVAWESRR